MTRHPQKARIRERCPESGLWEVSLGRVVGKPPKWSENGVLGITPSRRRNDFRQW